MMERDATSLDGWSGGGKQIAPSAKTRKRRGLGGIDSRPKQRKDGDTNNNNYNASTLYPTYPRGTTTMSHPTIVPTSAPSHPSSIHPYARLPSSAHPTPTTHPTHPPSSQPIPTPTLHKPKSKLRLRLKLTPPHPSPLALQIPSEPVPALSSGWRKENTNNTIPPTGTTTATTRPQMQQGGVGGKNSKFLAQARALSLRPPSNAPLSNPLTLSATAPTAPAPLRTVSLQPTTKSEHAHKPPPPAASQQARVQTFVRRVSEGEARAGAGGLEGVGWGVMGRVSSEGEGEKVDNKNNNRLSIGITRPASAQSFTSNTTFSPSFSTTPAPSLFYSATTTTTTTATPSIPNSSTLLDPSSGTTTGSGEKEILNPEPASLDVPSANASYLSLELTEPPTPTPADTSFRSPETTPPHAQEASKASSSPFSQRCGKDSAVHLSPSDHEHSTGWTDQSASGEGTGEESFLSISSPDQGKSTSEEFGNDRSGTHSGDLEYSSGYADTSLEVSGYDGSPSPARPAEEGREGREEARGKEGRVVEVEQGTGTGVGGEGGKGGKGVEDIFSLSDQQLSDRFKFVEEIGFGNWGSVWMCKPRPTSSHPLSLLLSSSPLPRSSSHTRAPRATPNSIIASQHHPTRVAIKLVHRSKTPTTAARVRALWSEMKVIRTLRGDPHPSVVGFGSFVITPSYALIVMPFFEKLMPVNVPEDKAKGYFKQLTSALAYLHDKGITHNDLKPANILLSHSDVPVLVDFGFAQKWDMHELDLAAGGVVKEPFWSEISWGTPEYLDPPRARGMKHDERLSDVWSMGVTFFEILSGRTPFEISEDEDFSTPEQLKVYYERTLTGVWLGDWKMSKAMESLLRGMIQPNHAKRLTALQAHHHQALARSSSTEIVTPPFVRTAASMPDFSPGAMAKAKARKEEKKRREAEKAEKERERQEKELAMMEQAEKENAAAVLVASPVRQLLVEPPTMTSTPIKIPSAGNSHTSTPIRVEGASPALPIVTPIAHEKRLVETTPPFDKTASPVVDGKAKAKAETKRVKEKISMTFKEVVGGKRAVLGDSGGRANALVVKQEEQVRASAEKEREASATPEKNITVRRKHKRKPSENHENVANTSKEDAKPVEMRPVSTVDIAPDNQARVSQIVRVKSIDELRRVTSRDAILNESTATKPSSPIMIPVNTNEGGAKRDSLRSQATGSDPDLKARRRHSRVLSDGGNITLSYRDSTEIEVAKAIDVAMPSSPLREEIEQEERLMEGQDLTPSTPRTPPKAGKVATSPERVKVQQQFAAAARAFPLSRGDSALSELRERIVQVDKAVRFRTTSGDLMPSPRVTLEARTPKSSLPAANAAAARAADAIALDSRLDRIALWVKNVERIVDDARQVISEVQQERSLPPLPKNKLSDNTMAIIKAKRSSSRLSGRIETLKVDARDGHARSGSGISTQVEPATPPKWKGAREEFEGMREPVVERESTKIRRRRSDLTDFRSSTFAAVAEDEPVRVRSQTPLILAPVSNKPLNHLHSNTTRPSLDHKIRSHRSMGDLRRSENFIRDPYDRLLSSRDGVIRQGDGYSSLKPKGKAPKFVGGNKGFLGGLFGGKEKEKEREEVSMVVNQGSPVHGGKFKGFMKAVFGGGK